MSGHIFTSALLHVDVDDNQFQTLNAVKVWQVRNTSFLTFLELLEAIPSIGTIERAQARSAFKSFDCVP